MTTTTITTRIDDKLAKEVGALAANMDRSRNWVIEDAIRRYMEVERAQIEGIKDSIKWFRTHKGIPHEQVMAEMDELLAGYGVPPRKTKK